MSTTADPTALLPMNLGDHRDQVPPTPDNPQETTPEESLEQLGISEEDKAKLVSIATSYRTGWAPDRLLRMPDWMRNDWMYRGRQILGWDQQGCCWYDALAEYMQAGSPDGDASYLLDRFKNNITKMLGTAFVGTMSRSVPPTVIRPENAAIEADVTTAKAAGEAIGIIERFNDIRGMVRDQNTKLYLFGCYFKHTRTVIDGAWAGFDEEPVYGDVTTILTDRYHCSCGQDVPVGQQNSSPEASQDSQGLQGGMEAQAPPTADSGSAGATCPACNTVLGSADFYPSEPVTEEKKIGTRKVPRAMIKWSVHGPLEVDADPEAKKISDSPILALDMEIDIGTARRTFKAAADRIQEGAQTSTTPNAAFERLRRSESYSQGNAYTADSFNQKPTYSQIWMQPDSYYREASNDKDAQGMTFSDRMMAAAPDGLKLSMVGDYVADVRKACLEKEWTACVLIEGCGLYPPSPADDVVPFNVRINGAMDIIDAHYETCASGIVLADSSRIDRREIKDEKMSPGRITFVKVKGSAQDMPLENCIWQLKLEMDQGIVSYVPMLANLAQQIASLPPQIFGVGTQPGVETKGGQAQQLDQAQISLNVFFENEKAEHAAAAQNAIEELQKDFKLGLIKEIWDVVESNGSQFRNNYVNLQKMNGRIRVYPMPDQGLPQSPEQQRQAHQMIIEEAGKGNPLATEVMDSVPNQEIILASLCGSEMELPSADQRARTTQHINILLETPAEKCPMAVTEGPDGQPGTQPDLPVKPAIGIDNWKVLEDTIKGFRRKNWDGEASNPFGWQQLEKYYQLAKQLETQEAVEDAKRKMTVMSAGAPPPDTALERAKMMLFADASQAAQRLMAIGSIDPMTAMMGKGLPAVVSADKELLDAGLKAAQAK